MLKMTFKEAAAAVNSAASLQGGFTAVSTDTRNIIPGSLFVALKGESFDGNDFVGAALEGGAGAVICSRDCGYGSRQIIVDDTRKALLLLAGAVRNKKNIPVVGVTGSVGKTSTKEMIALVMSAKYNVLKNEGNLNNEIGVPRTLFNLEESTECAVIEMGMSGYGEISNMTRAVRPTVAVISNIGVSHIEKLGSREGILKAKMEILEGMKEGSTLFVNMDNDLLSAVKSDKYVIKGYGIENKDSLVRAEDISAGEDSIEFTAILGNEKCPCRLNVAGMHNVYNALAAIAMGSENGISLSDACKALENYRPTGLRQKITAINGVTVIEDCYNASPDSQQAALRVLGSMNVKRKIAVIGDMLELGSYSEKAHSDVGAFVYENGVDILYTIGEYSSFTSKKARELGVKNVYHYTDKPSLLGDLIKEIRSGDAVLFKGSRGMKMEEISAPLKASIEAGAK